MVLVKNMAAVEEADDALAADVRSECDAQYGQVLDVVIHTRGDRGPEEAVRVFVRFAKQGSAMKAYLGLDGRFFNERRLATWFYGEDAFDDRRLDE